MPTDGQEILGSRERVQDQSAAPDISLDIHDQDAFSGSQRHAPVRGGFATRTVRSEAGSEFVTIKALAEVENDIPSANSTVPSMSQQMQHNHSSGQAPNMAQSNWQMDSQEDQQDTSDQLLGSAIGVTVPGSDWLTRNAYNLAGEDATPGWQHGGSWLSRSPFAPSDLSMPVQLNENTVGSNTAGIANDEMNFDLLGSLGILARNRISPSPAALASPASSISRRRQSSSSQFAISSQASNRASEPNNPPPRRDQGNSNTLKTLHEASKTIYEEDFVETRRLPGIIESNAPLSSCPFHKLNSDDDLVQIVRGYPRVMTSPGVYPPFVHHKLYRCAAGDVSEPLARAFCCVGAFYASVPTSKTFVYSLINEQSSKLVKGFHQWPGSDTDMLAVVHAMCIYQILGFFVSSSREQARSTEVQHMYFLKMTRKLIRQYLQTASGENVEEVDWRKWIMNETIRRTVFLVNTINTLSCRIQKQDPNYFEPLDEHLVLNMCIPAPQSVWQASSAEEWMAAKAQLGADDVARSKLTVAQVVNHLKNDSFSGDIDTTGYSQRTGRLVQYGQLDEFTRLVVFTSSLQLDS